MNRPHTFAGNPLNRAEYERRDADWLAARKRDPDSRFLPLRQLDVLLEGEDPARLAWVSGDAAAGLDGPRFLLGLRDGVAHFAVDVSEDNEDLTAGDERQFVDVRTAGMLLTAADAGIAAQARAQVDWHARHGFCSVCGQPTEALRGGQQRTCGSCGADHFPRTDPVIIVVVTDGERCLLGQSHGRLSQMRMFSALAGFMDQGESIEEAVRREVLEEAGIRVGAVRYHSSQPWPFPSSLMIGCHADALTTDLRPDDVEMLSVQWFERETVQRALAGQDDQLRVPASFAIAHHLIRAWAEGRA
ncbi:MAG: NAD(+) diphosphatase [Chloroflexi bacterium]|nr:NAD(+) diphosphatase [Chloroflexota bacterium]